ncbi:gp245 [Sphingomonas phage PAU]|uniref:flavodoxin n=1 Tax=Sphingomonas phage PAU TaxID=1150991 RepID=UPI00025733FB|nr:flavodoxin [Sphingomonas phage PAU]AFF28243.1 gp245 [Sphingomonas phage PAU]
MTIVYDSRTGNIERFINKVKEQTGWTFVKIDKNLVIDEKVHLVTYTTGFGHLPNPTKAFLANQSNVNNLLSVSVSGNRNWGPNFGKAGDIISDEYNVPLLLKFELSGNPSEIEAFIENIQKFS